MNQPPTMTPEQALQNLDTITAAVSTTREQHTLIMLSVQVLTAVLKKQAKPEAPQSETG